MIQGITARFLETGTGHLRIQSRTPVPHESVDLLAQELEEIEGDGPSEILLVQREHQGIGLIRGTSGNTGVQLRGVDTEWYQNDAGVQAYLQIRAGEFDLGSPEAIVLGEGLAQTLGAEVGQEVRVLTVRRGSTGSLLTRVSRFEVRGIVSSGYRDLDRLWAFIPIDRARTILPADSGTQIITLKIADPFILPNPLIVRDPELPRDLLRDVRATLGPQWQAQTWFELERSQYMNFLGTRDMLVFIMVVILLVAAVNISSTMINLVAERQQEFAILKALGASPWTIGRIVLTIGGLSGLGGIFLGLGFGSLGVLFVNEIIYVIEVLVNLFSAPGESVSILNPEFYLEQIPVLLLPGQLGLLGLAALFMTLISSLVPAYRAGKTPPAALFRRE